MFLRRLTIQLGVAATLVLSALVGAGWKWDHCIH